MRLVIASDTHSLHHGLVVPEGDVFIHAGDFSGRSSFDDIQDFGNWVRSLNFQHAIVIAGNHETLFEQEPELAKKILGPGIHYLQDQELVIDGIRFWGSPWQPEFYNWAFNLPKGPLLAEKWAMIPPKTDVLITHGPPLGILDFCHGRYEGCPDLLQRVETLQPKIHIFGHIHEGYGTFQKEKTTFINASVCTGSYQPINPLHVIDI